MKENILVTVTNKDIIDDLKKLGVKLVFPLNFFCVGIPNTFDLKDIKESNSYIYVNRILDSKDANKLNDILHNLPSNIKGIIFDDVGIIEMLKDINIEKILYNTHFATNYISINHYFDYVDEVIVSPDITEEEIDEIIKNANKDVSFFVFGLVPSMYSRRTLLTNYSKHNNLSYKNILNIENSNKKFITIENEYGTYIYHYPYYNGLKLLNKNSKYYFYHPILLANNDVINVLKNDLDNIEYDYGFLNTKTIYKIKNN